MQLPPIDRNPNLRTPLAGAESVAAKGVPAVPPVGGGNSLEPRPSVINLVGLSNKAMVGEAVYTSVSDPSRPGSEAATSPKDWTIHRPAPEKVEDPPPTPLSKMLMDHLKSVWVASAAAIHDPALNKNQNLPPPNALTGLTPSSPLTYSPTKIKKPEAIP